MTSERYRDLWKSIKTARGVPGDPFVREHGRYLGANSPYPFAMFEGFMRGSGPVVFYPAFYRRDSPVDAASSYGAVSTIPVSMDETEAYAALRKQLADFGPNVRDWLYVALGDAPLQSDPSVPGADPVHEQYQEAKWQLAGVGALVAVIAIVVLLR